MYAPRRMHPAGIALEVLVSLRGLALPLLLAVLFGAGTQSPVRAAAYGAIGVAIAIVAGIMRWWSTTWWLTDDALHRRTGILSADETVIPRARISSVDTIEGPLQRLFGVLELRVQTAGGGKHAEVALRAVGRTDAVRLRAILGHTGDTPDAHDARLRLGLGGLLAAAVTAPQLGVLLPALGALAAGGQDVMDELGPLRPGQVSGDAATVVLGVVALVLLAWIVSIAGAVVAFAGFEVTRDGDRLRIRRGLLSRRASTLPLGRVQAVRLVEGLLREPFGLAALRVETSGYAGEPAAAQTLFPILRRRDAARIIAQLVPALDVALEPLEPPPGRSRRRFFTMPVLAVVAIAVVLAIVLPAALPAVVVLLALAAAAGELRFRAAGWRLEDGRVVLRARRIGRSTLIARTARLQEHGTRQTPPQRAAGLADVHVAVGSGRRAAVRHLELATATRLLGALRTR